MDLFVFSAKTFVVEVVDVVVVDLVGATEEGLVAARVVAVEVKGMVGLVEVVDFVVVVDVVEIGPEAVLEEALVAPLIELVGLVELGATLVFAFRVGLKGST